MESDVKNIVKTVISGDVVSQETKASGRWDTELTPEKLSVVTVSPRDMSITTLYYYSQYL